MHANKLESLWASFYEAALEPDHWWASLEPLADIAGARAVTFISVDIARGTMPFAYAKAKQLRHENSILQRWLAAGLADNPGARSIIALPPCRVARVPEPPCRSDLENSRLWRDFLAPLDVELSVATKIVAEGTSVAILSAHRSRRQGDFSNRQIQVLERAALHMRRATQIMLRLRSADEVRRASLEVIECLALGVYLFDGSCRLTYANAAGRELAVGDGLSITHGALIASDSDDSARLQRAIGAASKTGAGRGVHSGGALSISRPSGKRSYEIIVAPLGLGSGPVLGSSTRPVVVVFAEDPSRKPQSMSQLLIQELRLTPAEAALALEVARGQGLPQVADALGISINTAKTQLQSIFGKTGTRRQAELVQLFSSGLAGLIRTPSSG